MKIYNDRFVLRPWVEEDAPQLAKIANNKKIFDNLRDGFPYPYTLENAIEYIKATKEANNSDLSLAIEVDGQAQGSIGAFFKDNIYRINAEIGYYLSEEYWGGGIMTEVIDEIVKYIFKNFEVSRIYAEPFARNIGSRRALEKAGFRLEGALKKNVIKNNMIEDSCIYAILKEEYQAQDKRRVCGR